MTSRVMHPECRPLRHHGKRRIGVVLCHGFSGSPASLKPWALDLISRGFTVTLPRLPGHGTHWSEMVLTTWHDWYAALDAEYHWVRERCDEVVVAGLSMGGALALLLAQRHKVAGVILVNPAIASDKIAFKFVPAASKFISTAAGISNDINRSGIDEVAYDRTPLKPAASMLQMWKVIVPQLDQIKVPVLLFTSRIDHVVDRATGRLLEEKIDQLDHRWLDNSYHVATLDYDAPLIFNESVAFIERILSR